MTELTPAQLAFLAKRLPRIVGIIQYPPSMTCMIYWKQNTDYPEPIKHTGYAYLVGFVEGQLNDGEFWVYEGLRIEMAIEQWKVANPNLNPWESASYKDIRCLELKQSLTERLTALMQVLEDKQ